MFLRLAFAVNIMSNPEIMIVDEALAVGDMNFKAKCMTALKRIQEGGATILFVSHDIGSVKSLCSRGVYLENGDTKMIGSAPDVAELYIRNMREEMNKETQQSSCIPTARISTPKAAQVDDKVNKEANTVLKRSDEFDKRVASFRYGTGDVKVTYVELLNMTDKSVELVEFNQKVKVRIFFEAFIEKNISVSFNIYDDKKVNLTGCGFSQVEQEFLLTGMGGQYVVEYTLRLPLQEGSYSLRTQVSSPVTIGVTAEFLDVVEDAVVFQMEKRINSKIWSKVHLFPSFKLERIE